MKDVKWRLRIAGDMRHDALEDLGLVSRGRPQLRIEILEFNLLATKVIAEATKGAPFVLLARLIREGVVLDALAHGVRVRL